jgi:hypothetical protein
MCVEGVLVGGEGEQRTLRWGSVVDTLHILMWKKTMEPLAIALSEAGRGSSGRDGGMI